MGERTLCANKETLCANEVTMHVVYVSAPANLILSFACASLIFISSVIAVSDNWFYAMLLVDYVSEFNNQSVIACKLERRYVCAVVLCAITRVDWELNPQETVQRWRYTGPKDPSVVNTQHSMSILICGWNLQEFAQYCEVCICRSSIGQGQHLARQVVENINIFQIV